MESNPTVDYKAYVSTVKAKNERIAILENQLAQAKAGWNSCIADLRKATEICKETEDQMAEAKRARESFAGMWRRSCLEVNELEELLEKSERELAEARKTVQWTPITLENLPKIGDEVLEIWVMSERRNLSIATYDWNEEDMKYYTKHAKAYSRLINPPKDTPSK